jgi:competence protein ComEC
MINWATFPFVRYTPALMGGIVTYLYVGDSWPDIWPYAAACALLAVPLLVWAARQATPAAADMAGLWALLTMAVLGAAITQRTIESRRADHIFRFGSRIEAYRAVVDEATVVRPNTFATTLRVREVRVAGRWHSATGGVRISLPRAAGVAATSYGQIWLIRGHPDPSKPPLNPNEFDYQRYLEYRQVYHQHYVHPDQYQILGLAPPWVLKAIGMRTAEVLDGVFRHYIRAKREYAIASALVLGKQDEVDHETKQAYTATGTTHIMAVSGLQVGLLFAGMSWLLRLLFGRVRGFQYWSGGVGLAVIWSYAVLTGMSASVMRATVMFTFIIMGQMTGRQSNIFNTLACAAFFLLICNPFYITDVGFQLSFLAVLSIVYLQPKVVGWLDASAWFLARRRPWQPKAVQWWWRGNAWVWNAVWQATALSLAAQVATCALSLYYFHQFPLSFLLANLIAVPISTVSVYVGLVLLAARGLTAWLGSVCGVGNAWWLDWLPTFVARVFEWLVWSFNTVIFWISRVMANWVVREIHVSVLQTALIFGLIGTALVWVDTKRLAWLRWMAGLLACYIGSRVVEARQVAPDEEFIVYSIPRRSAIGFWQGAVAEFVTPDSMPLNETERTYRLLPGIIQRQARRTTYCVGWRGCTVPTRRLADADSANEKLWQKPGPLVLAHWRGLRLGFVSNRISSATQPTPLDVLVLRRNARVPPETIAAVFGSKVQVVFDSSCKIWYVARLDSTLKANGFRTWDVTERGAFRLHPPRY